MIVTQDDLIRKLAKKKNINISTAKEFLETLEKVILDCLSSTPLSEEITVKILNGLVVKRRFVKGRVYSQGAFRNHNSKDHVTVKAYIMRHYNDNLNKNLKTKGK